MKKIETPCIGVCSTGIGDDVCRGCKRYAQEVIAWNGYSEKVRNSILSRIDTLLDRIVLSRFTVLDQTALDAFLAEYKFRQASTESNGTKIFRILKAGGNQIMNPAQFGCALNQASQNLRFSDVCKEIDSDYYQLSVAHYERFFQVKPLTGR